MKKLIAFTAFALTAFASCTKPVSTECRNSVTFNTTGGFANVNGCPDYANSVGTGTVNTHAVGVSLIKTDTGNAVLLLVASHPFPYTIGVVAFRDTLSRLGTYTVYPVDSFENTYSDNLSGSQSYKCSGGTVSVTQADSSNVTGSFSINVFNSAATKTVTGSFVIHQPVIK